MIHTNVGNCVLIPDKRGEVLSWRNVKSLKTKVKIV
jgi:hypothetical protein